MLGDLLILGARDMDGEEDGHPSPNRIDTSDSPKSPPSATISLS